MKVQKDLCQRSDSFFRSGGRTLALLALTVGSFAMSPEVLATATAVETASAVNQSVTQNTYVKGTVVDEYGEPMVGVTVMVDGKSGVGTSTDIDGNFSLKVAPGTRLLFTYIGYDNVKAEASEGMKVTMKSGSVELDEVVAIGYGTVKKRDLTGAVSSVKAADLVKSPASNAMEAMQGMIPGMDIVRNSGKATSGVTMNIRGKRSLSNVKDEFDTDIANAPLFIIDGMQGGNFSDLAPSDIESIEVLKDASSTAIYGSQGANGVVIITTKRGKEGKTKISYNGYFGVNGKAQYPEVRMGDDYLQLTREAYRTAGQWSSPADDSKIFPIELWEAIQNNQWVNWRDLVEHTGIVQSHQVMASGGNAKTQSLLSAGYYQEKGQFKYDEMKRYSLRLNIDHTLSNLFKIGAQTQVTHFDQDDRSPNVLWRAVTNIPLGRPYDDEGNVVLWPLGPSHRVSPLADEATENTARHHVLKTSIIANGYVEITPLAGLSLRSVLGTNYTFYRGMDFEGAESIDRAGNESTSRSKVRSTERSFVNWDNVITYNRSFGEHTVGLTALTSWTQSKFNDLSAEGTGQLSDNYLYYNLGANDKNSYVIGSGFQQHNTFSYAIRANYNYKGRYLLTVSNRWDGDSRLAKGNKWAAFPSVSAAWRISEESFLEGAASWLNNAKIRLSWGKTGNSGINIYGTQSGVSPFTNAAFQDIGYTYYNFNQYVGNTDTGWEISKTWDLGLDLSFLNSRISATLDLYSTKTSDILLPRSLPTAFGASNASPFIMYQNIGSTSNKGIELSVTSVNIQNHDFTWITTLTFSANKEEITSLIDGQDIINAQEPETKSLLIGHPLNSFYTYKKLGIWQESEREEAAKFFKDDAKTQPFVPGDIKLADLDGNNIINGDDRTYIGSTSPKWMGGLMNTFRWKNFDANIYVIARIGQYINYDFSGAYDPTGSSNTAAYFQYWTPENPTNDFPRPALTAFYNYIGYQSMSYIEGSYWKLKTVSLGYTLPKGCLSKLGVSNLRVYATANNLFSFATNHLIKDYDAERGGSAKSPLQRQFVFGINLDF